MQLLNRLTVCLHWLCHSLHDLKSRNRWTLMSFWSSQDGIITWYDIFKLCYNVICTNWSTSQLYCSTQVFASVFTESNVPLLSTLPQQRH
jgi:hypothetical protein